MPKSASECRHIALPQPDAGRRYRRPPSAPRPPACGWGCARPGGRAASWCANETGNGGGRPPRRDATRSRTPVAVLRLAITPSGPVWCITRFAPSRCRANRSGTRARGPSPRSRRADGMRGAREGNRHPWLCAAASTATTISCSVSRTSTFDASFSDVGISRLRSRMQPKTKRERMAKASSQSALRDKA